MSLSVKISDLEYIQSQIELGNFDEALDVLAKILAKVRK